MQIAVTGLNYKTASLMLREQVHISETRAPEVLEKLRSIVSESMILSTCNRFEIIYCDPSIVVAQEKLVRLLQNEMGVNENELDGALYHHRDQEAVRHIFRVASSLDSMVIGETQILGQMKRFFGIAGHTGAVGTVLHSLMERAFSVAKKVRSETVIGSRPVSISSIAVELATRVFGSLRQKKALVIGAGKMSLLAVRYLQSQGISDLMIANRTFEKAVEIAEQVHGRAVQMESLQQALEESDIVISSTGSSEPVIRKDHVQHAMARRKNRPMLFIDIAVPRDIDPGIHGIGNVFLYDIDDLKLVASKNSKERYEDAGKAEEIVLHEAQGYWNKFKEFEARPAIQEIQVHMEELRKREMEQSLERSGLLNPEQRNALEELSSRLISKILQGSFCEMRKLAAQPDSSEKVEFIKKLFLPA